MANQRRAGTMLVSSALLAVAPKCPICFLAYFGIFGVATSSASAYRAWLPPITAIWLLLTVATLAFQRRGRRRYGPPLLGFAAALVILSGKFILENQVLVVVGIVALLAAVVWRSWSRVSKAGDDCQQCEETFADEAASRTQY